MPSPLILAVIYVFIQLTTFINAQNTPPGSVSINVPWKAGHAAAFQDPYVIIYGGTTDPKANSTSTAGSNSVWIWNSVNGSWYDSTTLSTNNNKPQIYIKAVSLPSPGQTLILASNTTGGGSLLQKIDSNFWSWNNPTSSSSPSPISGYTMTLVGNTIYTYGGMSVDGNGQRMPGAVQNSLSTLDANTFSWGSGSNGPAVTDHSTCYIPACNCLVTFGGTQTGDPSQASQSIFVYSLTTQSWNLQINPNSINGSIPGPRRLHTATCLQDKMVVFGGGTTQPFDTDVWILQVPNDKSFTWARQPMKGQGPSSRMGHTAVDNGNKTKIYIFGGWGADNDSNMYVLDTEQWTWSTVSPSGIPHSQDTTSHESNSTPIGAIVGGVVGGVALIAAIALAGFFFLRKRKQRRLEKENMEKDSDGQSQEDYYWRYGDNVHHPHHGGLNGHGMGYEDDYQSYSLSDPNYSNANLMASHGGSNKRMSKALTSKTGTSSTRDSYLRYSDHGGTQSTVMEMVLTPSESNYDNNSFNNIRGSRQSLQASKVLLPHDIEGPGQVPNEYIAQKPNEFSVPTTRYSARHNNNSIPIDHYSTSVSPSNATTTDGAPLSSSMEVLRSIKTDGSGAFGQRNVKVTHSYASDSSNNNNHNSNLIHKISDIQSQDENDEDEDEYSVRDESTAPIQYIPGASKQFSIATTVTNSAPSQVQYNNAIPLTHHQYPSSSVPVAQPVSPQSNRMSESYGPGGRISMQSFQPSNHRHSQQHQQEQQDEALYDTISPLDRLATLGQTNGITYEQQPSNYFPNINVDSDKSMTPPNSTVPVVTSNQSSELTSNNNSNNNSNNSSKNLNNSNTVDISHSSSTVTNTTIDTSKSNNHHNSNSSSNDNSVSNNNDNSNGHNSNTNSNNTNNNSMNQQQQQNCLLIASMLPRRYKVDKTKSSIIGPTNSILFVQKQDIDANNTQSSHVAVKSFGRREAWERECRTLIKLKSSQVVTLIEVLTIQDDSHIPTPYYTNEQHTDTSSLPNGGEDDDGNVKYLTVMERLDETLATVIRRARPNSTDPTKQITQWSDQTTKAIAKDIIECLIWCHKKGIAFCDLKPSNIMHNFDEPWKLIDFEASRTIGEECVGVITPRYCPPEVARATTYGLEGANGVVATASVDLWALGCVLYELETKRPLFASNIKDETILHFVSHPSSSTPILNNGLRWNDQKELEIPQLERQVRNEHARQLIKTLLSRDPLKRGNAEQLLVSD
ncbi:hypothetical protein BJ944DRAFT_238548 [Cunninghamella echinulata]|nr:hypothetical protein BJ944DRAFT_238548 [Cunninghamella echinulata]